MKMVRPARIELASSERHSEALPIDQGRMVGVPRIGLGMHIGAGFTDPLSHQTWRHPEDFHWSGMVGALEAHAVAGTICFQDSAGCRFTTPVGHHAATR